MYHSYFGLSEAPFSIAPDPHYLYMSRRHQEALAHLLYGISGDGGFVLLTGDVGTGKTTICRCLLEQIPGSCDVAYIFNPKLTVEELLASICSEFRIEVPARRVTIKTYVDRINAYLLDAHANNRRAVLIIDEAQNLSADVLEQMRLLTNLETSQRKLLQIILIGQPELAEMLSRRSLSQLAQRVVARFHLGPLTKTEVAAYVRHRLDVSGARQLLFPPALTGHLFRLSHGIPRLINVICDRALLGTYVQGKDRVDRATLAQAAREVLFKPVSRRRRLLDFFFKKSAPSNPVTAVGRTAGTEFRRQGRGSRDADGASELAGNAQSTQACQEQTAAHSRDGFEWPAGESRSRSKARAYAALFATWGMTYKGGTVASQAAPFGLRCRTARGDFDELRGLNRPAVLRLRDRKGRPFYATLIALDEDVATLAMGTVNRPMHLGALRPLWSGEYTMLWRLDGARENLWPGESGPPVQWLRNRLAAVQGSPGETAVNSLFDDGLVTEVKKFQSANGLIPDGAVGVETLLRITGATDPDAPKLVRSAPSD
jgi:general secretion pathway protein A